MLAWLRALPRRDELLLAALALAVFLPGIGARDLWNPDEPRYATVAREMLERDDWLVPYLNGRVYSEKPPMQFWAIAGFGLLRGGVDAVAARLPAVAAVTATLLMTFALARRLFDREVAWLSALVFGSSLRILWQGRIGQIDMLLVALVTAAMLAFWRLARDRQPSGAWLFFAFAGLATLAKGPVGLLPPLLSVVAFCLWTGRREVLRELHIGRGLALWAGIAVAWLLPAASRAGGDYLATMLVRQNLERFADPWHHFQPWYYYLTVLPAEFFPWAWLAPAALLAGWRGLAGERRDAWRWALAWVAVTLLFFSLSSAKRTVYIVTMFPGLAIAVGAGLAEIRRRWPAERRWLVVPGFAVAALAAAVALAAAAAPSLSARLPRLAAKASQLEEFGPHLPWEIAAIAASLALAAAMAARLFASARILAGTVRLAAGMALFAALASVLVLPQFDVIKSARPMARLIAARVAVDEPIAIFPRLDPTFAFWSRRTFEVPASPGELLAFARRPGRVWVLITRREAKRFAGRLALAEFAADRDRLDGYLLLTTAPPPRPLPEGPV